MRRNTMARTRMLPGTLAAFAVVLVGCQVIGGFESFEVGADGSAGGSAGAGGGAGGGSSGSAGTAGTGGTAGAAGASGTAGSGGTGGGTGTEGTACTDTAQCGALTCLFGFCRVKCKNDLECAKGSICLGTSTDGGCRLPGDKETKCTTGSCANGTLACGLDKTCRTPCSTAKSCPFQGQSCIAGACVSSSEEGFASTWGQCGAAGEVTCGDDGKTLTTCNIDAPGKVVKATCATPALCQAGISGGGKSCGSANCPQGDFTCQGADLMKCKADQTGYEKSATCASEALCLKGKGAGACATPLCGAGTTNPAARCTNGDLEVCSADQQQYETTACAPKQCNPSLKQCFDLKIDAKEVTRKQYAAFLATNPVATSLQGCAWNTDFKPDATCMANADVCDASKGTCDEHPQPCVDWCDAYSYCKAQGKHLCGKVGTPDAMVAVDQYADPGQSEWMNGCSAGGENTWTHGKVWVADPQGQWCDGDAKAKGTNGLTYPVGTLATCQSPAATYKGLFDLGGNVSEWENSCSIAVESGSASKDDTCRIRGGSYKSGKVQLQCDADPQKPARSFVAPDIGFRCCG